MATVKVNRNVWGNYKCHKSAQCVETYGQEFDAKEWLSNELLAGHKLSPKSDITMADVERHRKDMERA